MGIYPQNLKTFIHKDICKTVFTAASFPVAKPWKQPKCPFLDDWIKKTWYIYTVEYYSTMRRDEILLFATTWMKHENIVLSKISERKSLEPHNFIHVG